MSEETTCEQCEEREATHEVEVYPASRWNPRETIALCDECYDDEPSEAEIDAWIERAYGSR